MEGAGILLEVSKDVEDYVAVAREEHVVLRGLNGVEERLERSEGERGDGLVELAKPGRDRIQLRCQERDCA